MVLTLIIALIVACLAAIFRSEFEAWMPWVAERIRRQAIKAIRDEGLRLRYDEEWAAHLDEVPGFLGKVFCAMGFCIAASRESWNDRLDDAAYRIATLMVDSLFVASAALNGPSIGLEDGRTALSRFVGATLRELSFSLFMVAIRLNIAKPKLLRDPHKRALATSYVNEWKAGFAEAVKGASKIEHGNGRVRVRLTITRPDTRR